MSTTPFEMSREELQAIVEKFREVKHDINNTLAVIMKRDRSDLAETFVQFTLDNLAGATNP